MKKMTKMQRNMLELALIHIRLDRMLMADSRGLVAGKEDEITAEEMFEEIGKDVRELRSMDDEKLLEFGTTHAISDLDLEMVTSVPVFETYHELYEYVSEHVDVGELVNQTVLEVLFHQIGV